MRLRSLLILLSGLSLGYATKVRAETKSSPGTAIQTSGDARRLSAAFVAVASKVRASVVQIDVAIAKGKRTEGRLSRNGEVPHAVGSGVILSTDGTILTNNHVIEDARGINIQLSDGRIVPAKVVGRDPSTDLAVLRISASDLTPAPLGNSDEADVGEWVIAVGCPYGLSQTITAGVLSAKGRGIGVNAVEDYLQTDASINPGNSGGPLVNLQGEVLGINTLGATNGAQGIGLAVPANLAKRVADEILRHGKVNRAWLGIGAQDLTPQLRAVLPSAPKDGVLINSVAAGGPADKANLLPGDILTKIDGRPLLEANDVIRAALLRDVGNTVSLEVVRKKQTYRTSITLASRNEPAPPLLPIQRSTKDPSGLGLSLTDRSLADSKGGSTTFAVVRKVTPDSAADRAGIEAEDVILDADDIVTPSSAKVTEALSDGRALLRIRRGQQAFFTAVEASR